MVNSTKQDEAAPLEFVVAVDAKSANRTAGQHPMVLHRITKRERRDTYLSAMASNVGFRAWLAKHSAPYVVTFTRLMRPGAKPYDEGDNLPMGFKHVRDAVAQLLGVDDSPASPIKWFYQQEPGDRFGGTRISIHGAKR